MHRPFARLLLSVFSLVLLGLTLSNPATAGPVTSSLMVPVDGLIFSPGGGFESVRLSGGVHIVTLIPPDPIEPVSVHIDLANVKGVGLTSGRDYVAIGAVDTAFFAPQEPVIPPNPIFPQFRIMPVGIPPDPITPGNPTMPITFKVQLRFDSAGNLLQDGTTVTLGSPTF